MTAISQREHHVEQQLLADFGILDALPQYGLSHNLTGNFNSLANR
jgi:hypothetical protein